MEVSVTINSAIIAVDIQSAELVSALFGNSWGYQHCVFALT